MDVWIILDKVWPLDDDECKNLSNYAYHTAKYTILDMVLYRIWWNPLAPYIPRAITPNALTFMGFICTTLIFALIMLENPHLDGVMEGSTLIKCALLIFVYQTFDAIDGLHARRLGCGSSLGQLLDHGMDAFSTGMLAFANIAALRLGHGWKGQLLLTMLMIQLLMYTWWEKTFKKFRSQTNNIGVTEGQFLLSGLFVFSAIFGHEVMKTEVKELVPWNIGAVGGFVLGDIIFAINIALFSYMLIADFAVALWRISFKSAKDYYCWVGFAMQIFLVPLYLNNPFMADYSLPICFALVAAQGTLVYRLILNTVIHRDYPIVQSSMIVMIIGGGICYVWDCDNCVYILTFTNLTMSVGHFFTTVHKIKHYLNVHLFHAPPLSTK